MKFPSPLLKGTLVKRYRRSLADIKLESGEIVTAHVFSLGPMFGCCEPGRPVLLSNSADPGRRHPLTWEMIDLRGFWVGVNPNVTRKVIQEAIASGEIESLRNYHIQSEPVYGKRGRVDFVLQNMKENCYINIHSVSWGENGKALFPEVDGEKHRKSLRELADIAARGHRVIDLFHVLRGDCEHLSPAGHIDARYAKIARDALRAGVEMMAFRATVNATEVSLGIPIPISFE